MEDSVFKVSNSELKTPAGSKGKSLRTAQHAFKGSVHPKIKILSVITHPHVVLTP